MTKKDILNENCFPVIPTRLGKINYCKRSKSGEHEFIEYDRWFWGMKKDKIGYKLIDKDEYDSLSSEGKKEICNPHYLISYRCKKCGKRRIDEQPLN